MGEEKIKELLGISQNEKLVVIQPYKKGGKTYYRAITYSHTEKTVKRYHVPRKIENQILFLWKQYQKEKEQLKTLEQEVKALLEKYRDAQKIREVLEKLSQESIIKTASSYALKSYTSKAKELFKEFIGELVKLYRQGVFKKLTILQVLYLLANLRELSKDQDKPEYFFKKGINTIIRVVRNERIPNPFGTLKNDFFLSGVQTPYDFLLSNFLEEIIGDTLTELLEKEVEKIEAQRKAKEYEEKMEKLKEVVSWLENLPLEIKTMAKEVISQNTLEIAEKFLKEMEMEGYSLKEIQDFMEKSRREDLIHYLSYLKEL